MTATVTATVTDIRGDAAQSETRADAARADTARDLAERDDAILHDSLYFQRVVGRLALAGLAGLGTCTWLLWDTLTAIGDARRLTLFFAGSFSLATFMSLAAVRFLVGRVFLGPAAQLSQAAERVADGDFAAYIPPARAHGAVTRLTRAMLRMTSSLRDMTKVLRTASHETTASAEAITAGGAHMAATAQHIADTSNDLSRRAGEMAVTIDALVADAGRLVAIAGELAEGAQAGVARNAQLRALAQESSARLAEGTAALDTLAADAHSSAAAVEELATASEEIQTFVTLVTKMARQSKLLALNAAMEAARAGEQGQGFAVVASEVRRLAASSSEAAERTEALVRGVLAHVAESRAASARAAGTVDAVRSATQLGLDSFRQVEAAARDAEHWTASIDRAASQSSEQVGQMSGRLEALAETTARFTAAMEEVAAASQEQSASTEQIAAAGHDLLRAAERLSRLTANFRVDEAGARTDASVDAPTLALVRDGQPAQSAA